MNVVRIYKADNGESFFEHDNDFSVRTEYEINVLTETAQAEYEKGNYSECKASEGGFPRRYHIDGRFLGDKGMHIRTKFHPSQNFIFIESDKNGSIEKIVEHAEKNPGDVKNLDL